MSENRLHRYYIGCVARDVGEPDKPVVPDHKCAAELEYVAARRPKITPKQRAHRFQHDLRPHDLRYSASLQTKSPVSFIIRVSQATKGDAVAVAQLGGATRRARSNSRNRRTATLELWPGIAQRAKVLVAERSAKMAQEDQYEDPLAP
jgi:hypothetical protein